MNTKKHYYILILLGLLILSAFLPFKTSNAQSSKIQLSKTYHKIYISQNKTYQIRNLKKGYTVSYKSSDANVASISQKKGVLHAKRIGKVTITISVYNKKKKKVKTLQDTVKIMCQKKPLPNAVFQIKKEINPWNFTITLSCNRILLKKEIKNSFLTIKKADKKGQSYKASFTSLSPNGRKITYTLSSSAQKKLCPSNHSKDGVYYISSHFFTKKLKTTYKERISSKTIAGFTMQSNGKPIANSKLILTCKGKVYTTKSDKNGYYKFKSVKNPLVLSAQKKGFISQSIPFATLLVKGSICENFILRSSSNLNQNSNHSLEFHLYDSNHLPAKDVSVYITKYRDSNILFSGKTDNFGNLLFCNDQNIQKGPCSVINYDQNLQLNLRNSYTPDTSHKYMVSSKHLNSTDNYTIHIKKSPLNASNTFYESMQFSFSYENLMTTYALFSIKLFPCPSLSLKQLSQKWDIISPIVSSDTLCLQLFEKTSHYAFYQKTISIKDTYYPNTSCLPDFPDLFLPNDTYYIQLKIKDSNQMIKGLSPVVPIKVTNGIASGSCINIQAPSQLRCLNYCEYDKNILTASYELYQKTDSCYFYQGTFQSDVFNFSSSNYLTADLFLKNLYLNAEYLIIPIQNSAFATHYYNITPTTSNTFVAPQTISQATPALQIHCLNNMFYTFKPSVPADFDTTGKLTVTNDIFTLTQNFVRSCQTYPNSVTAVHKNNGNLASVFLSNSTNTVLPLQKNKKGLITDIYTNGQPIKTNQISYHR